MIDYNSKEYIKGCLDGINLMTKILKKDIETQKEMIEKFLKSKVAK